MSQENVKRVVRALEASHDNPTAFLEILATDVRWEVEALDIPDSGDVWSGPAGVTEFFRRWVAPFDDWGYEVGEVIDAGKTVLVHIRQWGRGKGSGVPIQNRFWQAWTFRNGKVARTTHHRTRAEALQAAELSE